MKGKITAYIVKNINFLFCFIALALTSSCDSINENSNIDLPDGIGIYKLDDASLSDWTDAYMNYISDDEASFMLIKDNADTAVNVVCFANLSNGKLNHKVYFYLDSDYTVNALEIDNIFYINHSSASATQYSFIGYDNKGNKVGEIISKKHIAPLNTVKTKGWDTAAVFHDIFNIIENTENLDKGKYLDFGLSVGIDAAIGAIRLGAKWNLITSLIVEGGLYAYKEGTKAIEYGDIIPRIYLKNPHTATVTLNGIATENSIYVGILIGTDPDRLFYKDNSEIKLAHVGEEIEFSIPELTLGTYYIKPFIISDNICNKYKFESIREWFVRYGNTEKLKIPLIKVISHEEIYDEYYGRYHENADQYLAKIKISVSIDDYEKAAKWGVKISKGDKKHGYAVELDNIYTSWNVSDYTFTYMDTFTKQDFINDDDNDDSSITLYVSPYASDGINEVVCEGYKFTLCLRWVDLGLPSGILWAKYNVGATSPEEYGDYYAWGETEVKSSYSMSNYYLYGLNINISNTSYDVATQKWGDGAKIPSLDNIKELLNNCIWQHGRFCNGVKGSIAKGPNGNEIFLPYVGNRYGELKIEYDDVGYAGYYWSSIPNGDLAYILDCYSGDDTSGECHSYSDKDVGLAVRPVKDKN